MTKNYVYKNTQFDPLYYSWKYPDLKALKALKASKPLKTLNDKALLLHYKTHGIKENRNPYNNNNINRNILYNAIKLDLDYIYINGVFFSDLKLQYEYICIHEYNDLEPSLSSLEALSSLSTLSTLSTIEAIELRDKEEHDELLNKIRSEYIKSKKMKYLMSKIDRNSYNIKLDKLIFLLDNLTESNYLNLIPVDSYGVYDIEFNYKEYIKLYPPYSKVPLCFENYKIYRIKEKLIPNFKLAKAIEYNQRYLLDEYNELFKSIKFIPLNHNISIITRTHNRKELFNDLVKNIKEQSHSAITHYVSYDNKITELYVKEHKDLFGIKINEKLHPNLYFDIIYKNMKNVNQWILFLDDDDKLTFNSSLSFISQFFTHKDNLIIWRFYRNDKFIYPKNLYNPVIGEIATCNYAFHISKYELNKWRPTNTGDFNFFKYLYDKTDKSNIIYIDLPLTSVNYSNKLSGWSFS